MEFAPIIDISRHQGTIDFRVMHGKGVAGLIIRATHGTKVDDRLHEYVAGAREAGYEDRDLGFYTFINPKRGTPADTAAATVNAIEAALGHTDSLYMIDVERYTNEPPDRGQAPLKGAGFAAWLREHVAAVHRLAPKMKVIGYTNRGFWDSPEGPRDATLAGEIEWIVPRFPIFPSRKQRENPVLLDRFIRTSAKPPDPQGWADFILNITDKRPQPPKGADGFAGWQFSADFNSQGPVYGCQSAHLDLNIVRTEAWERWTGAASRPEQLAWVALATGETLARGTHRRSADGRAEVVHDDDGNVVVLSEVFATRTHDSDTSSLVMQTDGNLVLYAADTTTPLWSSQTSGNAGAELRVDRNGPAVVAADGRRLWPTVGVPVAGGQASEPAKATVRPNDGWIRIAERELGDGSRWRELAEINGGVDRELHPGDVITLP